MSIDNLYFYTNKRIYFLKKIILGLYLTLFVATAQASNQPQKVAAQPQQSQSYLKVQIQKNRTIEQQWAKQADDFIGLKRGTKPIQSPMKKLKGSYDNNMLNARNLQDSLSNI